MKFFYGAAYYPEYFHSDRMDTDFSMMQEAGFNVIRIAESTWSVLEPREGEFDFSYINAVLGKAPKYGLSVIIGTPTYAIPSWLAKKHPNIMADTKTGRAKYGRRQIFNLASEEYRMHAQICIEKLVRHTANHDCVIGFQVDNETKFYDNYGEELQTLFVEHLKQQYPDIRGLNRDFGLNYWSNSIACWEDFPDLKGCINAGLVSAYEEFAREYAAKFLHFQAEIVNQYKRPEQFVTHNFDFEWRKFGADIAQDGYSYGIQDGISHYLADRAMTVTGADIYHPTQEDLTGAEIAFCGDAVRSLKRSHYYVLEAQAQAFKYWCPYPNQLKLHLFAHIASGASMLMYWNLHSIHSSFETYWKGVLSHDLQKNRVYREIGEIGEMLQKSDAKRFLIQKRNEMAILADTLSMSALKWFPVDKELSYNDIFRHMYDALYENNMECDILYSEHAEISGYKVIFTPALYCISENLAMKLREFVQKGGILVSSYRSFVCDRRIRVYDQVLPAFLEDVFGMHYDEHTNPVNTFVEETGNTAASGSSESTDDAGSSGIDSENRVRYIAELLTIDNATSLYSYRHKYWGEYHAITEHAFGNGTAVYIGTHLEKTLLKSLLKKMRERWRADGILFDSGFVKSCEFPLITRNGNNEYGEPLQYVLNFSDAEQEIVIRRDSEEVFSDHKWNAGDRIKLGAWDFCGLTVRQSV